MSIRPEVQEELRLLFKQGATPSRLMRLIADRHEGEHAMNGLIVIYFMETFGVPFVHNLKPHEDYQSIGLKYAFLNGDALYEMLQAKDDWNSGATEPAWFDSLKARNHTAHLQTASEQTPIELANSWDKLDDRERTFIHRIFANADGFYEQVRILSRLAEQLQQRVNELEAERVSGDKLIGKNGK